ncbi:peptidase [Microbacterium sp. 18062]|uniref:peptidase n=1 Tax=Microbacterium sp. 18062 TaxID=2681410 RepID=UPI00135A5BC8|nr:peptidase [Microbacterium sp. 18062]
MGFEIDWLAFVQVFLAALVATIVVVASYSLGLRMLVRAGRAPVVAPAEFTDAITVMSEKQRARAAKAAAKAAKRSPLTDGQKQIARIAAILCFAVCALAVLGGLLLIVIGL